MNFEEQPQFETDNTSHVDEQELAAQRIIAGVMHDHQSVIEPSSKLSPEEKIIARGAKENLQRWKKVDAQYMFSEPYVKMDEYLLKRYGADCRRYKMYHYLAGSTPPKSADLFDFPGEDSLVLFLERQAEIANSKNI